MNTMYEQETTSRLSRNHVISGQGSNCQIPEKLLPIRLLVISISLALALFSSGCIMTEYTKLTEATYPPSSHLNVYWGDERVAVKEDYIKIGTINAIWIGETKMYPVWWGQAHDGSKQLDAEPKAPLPEIYKTKAMELGADALLMENMLETTKICSSTIVTQYANTTTYWSEIWYSATAVAIKFHKKSPTELNSQRVIR